MENDNIEGALAQLSGQVMACTALINAMIGCSDETNFLGTVAVYERDHALMRAPDCATEFERVTLLESAAHLERFMAYITRRAQTLRTKVAEGTAISNQPIVDPSDIPPLAPE